MLETIIISGGSGLLATNLACRFQNDFNVVLLLHDRVIHLDGCRTEIVRDFEQSTLLQILDRYSPKLWINAAGLTSVEHCEKHPVTAHEVNVDLAAISAKCCFKADVFFVQISSDHLFDGTHSFTDETAEHAPLNVYAETKAAAEREVLENHPQALVLRTSFFGWGTSYRHSFSDWIIDALRESRKISLFEDVWITPVSTHVLADCLLQLYEKKAQGIFNVASSERVSKFDFGILLADVFALDSSCLEPGSISDKPDLVHRPHDMSLSNTKLLGMLGEMPTLQSQFEDLKNDENLSPKYLVGNGVIPYGKHFIDDADVLAVTSVLRSNFLTQGPCVNEFERQISNVVGCEFAVAVSNGTAALHLACVALGLSSGDGVITTPLSFVATANAILYAGAIPVFADIDPHTLNISVESVREKLRDNPKVKAIIVVHFAGAPGPMQELRELADEYGVKIIEDASHALGASYANGEKVGSGAFAEAATFSLHPVKGVTAGEGGVVTTNDEFTYHRLLKLRSHGITKGNFAFLGISHPSGDLVDQESAIENGELRPWYYEMQELGFNYRLTDFQSALATSQLGKLNRYLAKKRQLVGLYDEAFRDIENINATQLALRSFSAHHIYVTEVNFDAIGTTRHRFMKEMMASGVGTQVHYIPIVSQPFYRQKGFRLDDYPNTKAFYDKALTLPLYFQITPWQQEQVIDVVKGLVHVPT